MASYTKRTAWPPKPDISSGNTWARPNAAEYKQAYLAWSLPNDALVPRDIARDGLDPKGVLARNIMEAIKRHEASRDQYFDGKLNRVLDSQNYPDKRYDREIALPTDYSKPLVSQQNVMSWTTNQWIVEGCRKDYLPVSRLIGWGVDRKPAHIIPGGDPNATFSPWQLYTIALTNSPYNPAYWVARAFQFFQLGFFDLALGDAYRAMILAEVITDPFKRNKRPGLYNLVHNAVEQHLLLAAKAEPAVLERLRSNFGVPYFLYPLRQAVNHTISLSLIQTESWRDYEIHESYLLNRLVMNEEDKKLFVSRKERYAAVVKRALGDQFQGHAWRHEIRGGYVVGKQHPQALAIKRSTDGFCARLTAEYVRGCEDIADELLEVRAKSTPDGNGPEELGVFASTDIPSGTLILIDEPNVRGLSRFLEDIGKVEEVRGYARRNEGLNRIADSPPRLKPERYLCENCFSKPRAFEVLHAHYEALKLPEDDAADGGHPDNVCKCAMADPHIHFCWKDNRLEEEWLARFPDGLSDYDRSGSEPTPATTTASQVHKEKRVLKQVRRQNRAVRGATGRSAVRQEYSDGGDSEGEAPPAGRGNFYDAHVDSQVVQYENARGETYFGRLDERGCLWTLDGRPAWGDFDALVKGAGSESDQDEAFAGYMNPRKRRAKTKGGRGGRARVQLPNGRMSCLHPCSQSGRCRHACCTLGVVGLPQAIQPAPEPEPRGTCLQVARNAFHHAACGAQDWRWLHVATQADWEDHNAILSLLLKEIFDLTLEAQKIPLHRWISPCEIDPMIALCGGEDRPEERFPFSWSGNIVVPFDILEALGVNIFADHRFDTWAIQVALRKLLLNAVPWDAHRRGEAGDPFPRGPKIPASSTPESFYTFLLYSNFALINHGCADSANAEWSFDLQERHDGPGEQQSQPGIPNMILVRTTRAIAKGEEIRVKYFPDEDMSVRRWKAKRLFGGRVCSCGACGEESSEESE